MHRAAFLFILPAITVATAFAQSAPADSPALVALVSEIQKLRLDLQATTVAAQRVQIALFRLQSQTTAVARAASHLDEVRARLSPILSHRKDLAARIPMIEERQRNSHDANELKSLGEVLQEVKAEVDRATSDEQRLETSEAEATSQLRTEQTKLETLQDQLDKLDRILDSFSQK